MELRGQTQAAAFSWKRKGSGTRMVAEDVVRNIVKIYLECRACPIGCEV